LAAVIRSFKAGETPRYIHENPILWAEDEENPERAF
jgi:hypothetical protein